MDQIGWWIAKLAEALWESVATVVNHWPIEGVLVVSALLIFVLIVRPLLNAPT